MDRIRHATMHTRMNDILLALVRRYESLNIDVSCLSVILSLGRMKVCSYLSVTN